MRVWPIDFCLLEQNELGTEFALHELEDFLGRSALLTEELVAGEGQQLEAAFLELVVHGSQQLIVGRGEPSLAGHIHHQNGLHSLVGREWDLFPPDVLCRQFEEGLRGFFQLLGAGLEESAPHLFKKLVSSQDLSGPSGKLKNKTLFRFLLTVHIAIKQCLI